VFIPSIIRDRVRDEIERELGALVPQIVAALHPQQVLLFGSAARGRAGEMSDIDLCVIADTNLKFHDRMGLVLDLYQGDRELQVLVYTPEEWQRMLAEGRDFIRTIACEGRVLHAEGQGGGRVLKEWQETSFPP
jgi:predicted nucleotidyltransferase